MVKKISKIFIVFSLSFLMVFNFAFVGASATEIQTTNNQVDISKLEIGEEVVLVSDPINELTVTVTVVDRKPLISTFEVGDSGWSAGYCPSTATELYVRAHGAAADVTYNVDVINNVLSAPYNVNIDYDFYSISNVRSSCVNSVATASAPAQASVTWVFTFQLTGGSDTGYLNFYMNNNNQVRTTYKI